MRASFMSVCAVLSLSACASMAQQDVPAVIVEPTEESRAELTQTVSSALHVPTVTLANDALTRESLLIIERKPARDAAGQRLSGRDYGRPEHFQLVKAKTSCVLIHEGTGKRYELTQSKCVPT